jgi:hypothetical protein
MNEAIKRSERLYVEDYVVGLGMTAVKLSNGSCGLTHTFREEIFGGCSPFPSLLESGIEARKFIELYDTTDILLSSLGLATINAVINSEVSFTKSGDIFDSLAITHNDTVALVGDIIPLAASIRQFGPKKIYIFERRGETGKLPDWAIYQLMNEIDVLLLSSSTLINKTFFNLVKEAKTDRIALIGPSTTFCPHILDKVKIFGGAKVIDADKALKISARAGGTKNIYKDGAAEKVQLIP